MDEAEAAPAACITLAIIRISIPVDKAHKRLPGINKDTVFFTACFKSGNKYG